METTTFKKLRNIARRKHIKTIILQGGTSSGKTYAVLELLILIISQEKPGTICSIVSESLPHLKRGALRDFLNILKRKGVYNEKNHNKSNNSYEFTGGGTVEFFGADGAESMKTGKRHYLFVNEATGVSYSEFSELHKRTSKMTFVDFNPSSKFWAHKLPDIEGDMAELFISTYVDNSFLDPTTKEKIELERPVYDKSGKLLRGNPQWWRVYGLGLIGSHEGLIFKEAENWEITDWKPKIEEAVACGIDWGYSQDQTAVVCGFRYEKGFFLKTYLYKRGMVPDELKKELEKMKLPKNIPIFADSASPMMIEVLKRAGWYNVEGCKKYAGSVKDTISLMQGIRFYINKEDDLYSELLQYQWKKDKKTGDDTDIPEGIDHAIDACRYLFQGIEKPKRVSVKPVVM